MDAIPETPSAEERTMSIRRHFITIRPRAARLDAANDAMPQRITIAGRQVDVTEDNRDMVLRVIDNDAAAAFEAATYGRPYRSRVAIAA